MWQSQSSTSWSVLCYPPASGTLLVQGAVGCQLAHTLTPLSSPYEKSLSGVRPKVRCSGDGAVGITGVWRGNAFV